MNSSVPAVRRSWICASCRGTARRLYSAGSSPKNPPPPPSSGAAKLTTRRLIHIQGQEAPKFLQGIITNNVKPESRTGFYAAFLTAQGKVLNDVFVYPTTGSSWSKSDEHGYLVEVDGEQASPLLAHFKRHKLRAKLAIRLLDEGELSVWSAWKADEKWTPHSSTFGSTGDGNGSEEGLLGMVDARATNMGQRLLLPSTSDHSSPLKAHKSLESLEEAPLSAYTIRRYLRGVPEGQKEIPRDNTFPMNSDIDVMNGIDFKKGCYLGQELTIRTHHTGVVRRRVLPVSLYHPSEGPPEKLEYRAESSFGQLAQDTDIKILGKRGRPGKWIAGVGNVGLAMCRIEMMTDLTVSSEPSTFSPDDRFMIQATEDGDEGQEVGVKAFLPDWLRGRIRGPKVQKRVE